MATFDERGQQGREGGLKSESETKAPSAHEVISGRPLTLPPGYLQNYRLAGEGNIDLPAGYQKYYGLIQRKASEGGVQADATQALDEAARDGGSPLDPRIQRQAEQSTGSDLKDVRVHTGGPAEQAAAAVGSRAHTIGRDIYFGAGEYRPGTREGDHLHFHELAHAIQNQRSGVGSLQAKLTVSQTGDPAECEADTAADQMMAGRPVAIEQRSSGGVHRKAISDPHPPEHQPSAVRVWQLPHFPEARLRPGDQIEGLSQQLWTSVLATPHSEGPSLIGPLPIEVAGVVVKRESFLIWVENRRIQGWMPASELPLGAYRRGNWLLWSDGHELQVIRDRMDRAASISERDHVTGRDSERRAEAAEELNRDLEHYLALGSSIEHARHQVYTAHRDVLVQLVQDSFRVFGAVAGVLSAEGTIEAVGDGLGRWAQKKTAAAPKATPEQHALAEIYRRAPELVAEFPHLGFLEPTEENLAGMARLANLFDDVNLSPELRQQFLADLKAQVGASELPPGRLHKLMRDVAHGRPQAYLRQGAHPTAQDIEGMGGLKRAVSLKSALATLTTNEWYASAVAKSNDTLPKDRSQFEWRKHGHLLFELVTSGEVSFDPNQHLDSSALVRGAEPGSSGWYFGANDAGAAIQSPPTMQTRLAVGPEYLHGYFVLDLATETAVSHGAAKPTALDLTVSPLGKLNMRSEPVGRTDPTVPGQRSVREVVLPPLPLSAMSKVTYVPGR